MTPLAVVGVMVAGGLGAAARFLVDGLVRSAVRTVFPLGTVVINVTGSFALGVVAGLASAQLLPAPWPTVVGTGFLGGYTTFSAASVETVRLVQDRRVGLALLNGLGSVVVTVAAAAIGLTVGLRLG